MVNWKLLQWEIAVCAPVPPTGKISIYPNLQKNFACGGLQNIVYLVRYFDSKLNSKIHYVFFCYLLNPNMSGRNFQFTRLTFNLLTRFPFIWFTFNFFQFTVGDTQSLATTKDSIYPSDNYNFNLPKSSFNLPRTTIRILIYPTDKSSFLLG